MIGSVPSRHFVKYTFLKVDPAWRRLPDSERDEHKREFLAACEDFGEDHLLRAFSLVGTRGDADMLILSQAENLERIHEFHVILQQSGLMKWSAMPYSFLAMTKPSEYSEESRLEVRPAHGQYLFIYPFVKTRAWYNLAADERWRIMQDHISVGKEFPSVDLNTSYSFGLDDQEFVVAFEADNPGGLPRPGPEAADHRVEHVHPARHPHLHLRHDVCRARPRGARRHRAARLGLRRSAPCRRRVSDRSQPTGILKV